MPTIGSKSYLQRNVSGDCATMARNGGRKRTVASLWCAGINASVPALWTNHETLFPNSREPKRHGDKADNPSDHPPKTIGRSKPIRRLSRRSPVRARRQPCPPAGGGGGGGGRPGPPAPRPPENRPWNPAGWR